MLVFLNNVMLHPSMNLRNLLRDKIENMFIRDSKPQLEVNHEV